MGLFPKTIYECRKREKGPKAEKKISIIRHWGEGPEMLFQSESPEDARWTPAWSWV